MTMRDDDEVRRPSSHQVGEKLDDLSTAELAMRIAVLRDEIVRLEAARAAKENAAVAATAIFKT